MEEALLLTIAKATGLPTDFVVGNIIKLLQDKGKNPQEMTLEDLREVLIPFMQNLFCEVASGENEFIILSD